MKKTLLLTLIMTLFLVGCAPADESGSLSASGVIEANELLITPELGGAITVMDADEGDPVSAGDLLFSLDDSLYTAEMNSLEAALNAAEAQVDLAAASLETAELQYEQILTAALIAEGETRTTAWDESKPSEFDLPLWYYTKAEKRAALQTEIENAEEKLADALEKLEKTEDKVGAQEFIDAEVALAEARTAFEIAQGIVDDATTGDLRDAAQVALDDAEIDLNDAQEDYDDLLDTDDAADVLEARADATVAQERYDRAMDMWRAIQVGEDAPEVKMAAQMVEQAEVALKAAETAVTQVEAQMISLKAQMAKLDTFSPIDGTVLTRSIDVGEVVQPGMATMTIAPLDELTVTVYIPEDRYGEVNLGDIATLSVDSFPEASFTATVVRIADQAEYTPRNVQTKEERQTTVYAIKLSVDNPDGKLKPGMPVDLVFEEKAE